MVKVNEDEEKRIVAQEQQNSILSTLHRILTPFLLRRVRADVDLDIPPKKEVRYVRFHSKVRKFMM